MPDFDDEPNAVFDEQFGALRNKVSMLVPVPPAEEIVARGRRRRQTAHSLLAGLVVVLAVGAGSLLLGPLRPAPGPALPADGSSTVAVPPYSPTFGSVREPLGATIPAGFLPAEGRALADRKGVGRLCPGGSEPATDAEVVAARSLRDAQGGQVTLLVYAVGLVASRAFDGYQAEVARCTTATDQGLTWRKESEPMSFGAAAVRVTTRYTKNTRGALPPAQTEVVIRFGSSLLLVSGRDPAAVDRVWGGLHDRLCLFARDCKPRAGRPAALPSLTAGGQAFAVSLATDQAGDPTALGRAVAYAAELGYRTSLVSVDCDDGARAGLGLPADAPYKYVPIYFATRAEADAFVTASTRPVGPVVTVRTYCTG